MTASVRAFKELRFVQPSSPHLGPTPEVSLDLRHQTTPGRLVCCSSSCSAIPSAMRKLCSSPQREPVNNHFQASILSVELTEVQIVHALVRGHSRSRFSADLCCSNLKGTLRDGGQVCQICLPTLRLPILFPQPGCMLTTKFSVRRAQDANSCVLQRWKFSQRVHQGWIGSCWTCYG